MPKVFRQPKTLKGGGGLMQKISNLTLMVDLENEGQTHL